MSWSMAARTREAWLEELRIENEAYADFADRVARNDPDWGIYFPGDPRPAIPWWRRLLKL